MNQHLPSLMSWRTPAMIFINNKYTATYYRIVERANNRTLSGYTENHHIIPKSIGGDNTQNNLVKLTAREHFICHWLLPKMLVGQPREKMIYAIKLMCHCGSHRLASRVYETLKNEFSEIRRAALSGKSLSDKTRERMRIAQFGRKMSETSILKRSITRTGQKISNHSAVANKAKSDRMLGVPRSPETVAKIASANRGQKHKPQRILVCPHCGQTGGQGNMKRFHFTRCKSMFVLAASNIGKIAPISGANLN